MIILSFDSPKGNMQEKATTKTNFQFLFFTQCHTPYRHEAGGSHFSWTSTAPILTVNRIEIIVLNFRFIFFTTN